MQTIFVVIILLILKALQYFNSFILAKFFNIKESTVVVIVILAVSVWMYLIAFFNKRKMSKKVNNIWFAMAAIISFLGLCYPIFLFATLAGVFLYGFFSTEAEVLQPITKNIPKYVLPTVSLLPVAFFWVFPQQDVIGTQIIYIFSIIFTYIASYESPKQKGNVTIASPKKHAQGLILLFIGPLFIAVAGILYNALLNYKADIAASRLGVPALLALAVSFYSVGSILIYTLIAANVYTSKSK